MKDFEEKVLEVVKSIPRGKVVTYRDLARALNSKAYQAVGQALKRNSRPLEIPCHRVVCSSGRVGGYQGRGNSRKKISLLKEEGIEIQKGKMDLKRFGCRL